VNYNFIENTANKNYNNNFSRTMTVEKTDTQDEFAKARLKPMTSIPSEDDNYQKVSENFWCIRKHLTQILFPHAVLPLSFIAKCQSTLDC
jgi:hypothetical protein